MLTDLSEQVRICYQRAAECERRAAEQADPRLREDDLNAAQRWMTLARSYELSERLRRFTNNRTNSSAHEYRLYVYDREGRLVGPAIPIHADNDEGAITAAAQSVDVLEAELRDGERLVERLTGKR